MYTVTLFPQVSTPHPAPLVSARSLVTDRLYLFLQLGHVERSAARRRRSRRSRGQPPCRLTLDFGAHKLRHRPSGEQPGLLGLASHVVGQLQAEIDLRHSANLRPEPADFQHRHGMRQRRCVAPSILDSADCLISTAMHDDVPIYSDTNIFAKL
jgi:hypothetical protein